MPLTPGQRRAAGLARFNEIRHQLEPLLNALLECPSHSRDHRPAVPHICGVYLFTEGANHRYVGRAKDLNKRFGQHVAPSSPSNQAAFAFNIAKRAAGLAGMNTNRTRQELAGDAAFDENHFKPAKERVREMDFRFVEVTNDPLSTVFEVYASLLLGTEGDFNLFATH